MPALILIIILFMSSIHAQDYIRALELIQEGKNQQGYRLLEDEFIKSKKNSDKARLSYLLSFSEPEFIKSSPIYYARFALKYATELNPDEVSKIKIQVADSYMSLGELEIANQLYQEVVKQSPDKKDYVTYQTGYYYLNKKLYGKALESWQSLVNSRSALKEHSLKSLGRYWEKMGMIGDIKTLSKESLFVEGFSISIDEREKDITLKDLNRFVESNATSEMLGAVIDKTLLFTKNPCAFVDWYDPNLALASSVVFPHLKKCSEKDNRNRNLLVVTEKSAKSIEEKKFLVSLYAELNPSKGCSLSASMEYPQGVFLLCQQGQSEIVQATSMVLEKSMSELYPLLNQSKVILSIKKADVKLKRNLIKQISESGFAQPFFTDPESFKELHLELSFSENVILDFLLNQKRQVTLLNEYKNSFRTTEGQLLIEYLVSGKAFEGDLCRVDGTVMKRVAFESKVKSRKLSQEEVNCAETFVSNDRVLKSLALEGIISSAIEIHQKDDVKLVYELSQISSVKNIPKIESIKAFAPMLGADIETYLRIKGTRMMNAKNTTAVLSVIKSFQRVRSQITNHSWSSDLIVNKTNQTYNELLSDFLNRNENALKRLEMFEDVKSFLEELRFV